MPVRRKGRTAADAVELFQRLAGTWVQERVIAPGGTYAGTASFKPIGAGVLAYAESGFITLGDGGALQASRRYVFKLEAPAIACYFDETPQHLFHVLHFAVDPSGQFAAVADHRCGDDDYHSTYTWRSPDAFMVTHRVAGPRKGYMMTTDYLRFEGARHGQIA